MSRGQSTLEYVVIIAVVVAGLITMQIYLKRSVQGKLRDATDQIGEQYAPGKVTSNFVSNSHSKREEKSLANGYSSSELKEAEIQKRTGNEFIKNLETETKLFTN